MRLLVAVLHREDLLDEVLSALVELEEPDAVVINQLAGPVLWERAIVAAGESGTTAQKERAAPRVGPMS